MSRADRAGDTLIEVIFAFAILGTIIGFAFTGVIQARKSAVAAQQRTQAQLLVQGQQEALKAYRSALPWNAARGCPSFLQGGAAGGCNNANIPDITQNSLATYCLLAIEQSSVKQWKLATTFNGGQPPEACFNVEEREGRYFAAEPWVDIRFNGGSGVTPTATTVQAEIIARWKDPFGVEQTVKTIVLLGEQQ